jgi:hypothetical protein
LADNVTGTPDPQTQAIVITDLWGELDDQLSASNSRNPAVGGLVFAFNDALWPVGNFHVGLGNLVDYTVDTSYDDYNTEGIILSSIVPDGVANAEYFGLVDQGRTQKQAYTALGQIYNTLLAVSQNQAPIVTAPQGSYSVPEGTRLTFTVTAIDPNPGDTITLSATLDGSLLPSSGAGATFTTNIPLNNQSTGTGTFDWTPQVGQQRPTPYSLLVTASDGVLSGITTVPITVTPTVQ